MIPNKKEENKILTFAAIAITIVVIILINLK